MVRLTERTSLMNFLRRHKDHSVCSDQFGKQANSMLSAAIEESGGNPDRESL